MPDDVNLDDLFRASPPKPARSEDVSLEDDVFTEGLQELPCADCQAPMRLKTSTFGKFFGCTNFSSTGCKGALRATSAGVPIGFPTPTKIRQARATLIHRIDQLIAKGQIPSADRWTWVENTFGKTIIEMTEADVLKALAVVDLEFPTQWDLMEAGLFDD